MSAFTTGFKIGIMNGLCQNFFGFSPLMCNPFRTWNWGWNPMFNTFPTIFPQFNLGFGGLYGLNIFDNFVPRLPNNTNMFPDYYYNLNSCLNFGNNMNVQNLPLLQSPSYNYQFPALPGLDTFTRTTTGNKTERTEKPENINSTKPSNQNSAAKDKKDVKSLSISNTGINFIKKHEGCVLKAYWDANGYAVGYGHHGKNITKDTKITQAQADEYLKQDLETFSNAVKNAVKVPLTQNQFDACVSLAYNIGPSGFKNSDVVKFLNSGDYAKAADAFKKHIYSSGKVNNTLVKRRNEERELFLKA